MIVIFVNILDYTNFRLRISHIQLIHQIVTLSAITLCTLTINITSVLSLHSDCVRDIAQAAGWHLTRLSWSLLFCRVSTLKIRECRAGIRWIKWWFCFTFTFISPPSNYLLRLCFWRSNLWRSLAIISKPRRVSVSKFSLFLFSTRDINWKVSLGSLFLIWWVHVKLSVICNDHHYVLCQILSSFALH